MCGKLSKGNVFESGGRLAGGRKKGEKWGKSGREGCERCLLIYL